MTDFANPVPLGRANSGAAVVYGDGLGALRYLERTDAMRAAAERAKAAAAAKQQEADSRDFASRLKLSDEGGVHYLPLLKTDADRAYQEMQGLVNDRTLSRNDRAVKQQQIIDGYNRKAKASVTNDKYLTDLGQRLLTDKRYDRDKTIERLNQTLYKDGQVLSPLEYDPQTAEKAVGTGNEHLNGVEVFKNYLRGSHPDAITNAKEALPGGRGYRNVASSDVYELTPDGKIKYDAKTNLPVVKATPQALNYFDSDPVNRQYLDGFEQQHQQRLAGAIEKMKNLEQLTPEEADAVELEKSPEGRRMELFKRGLMEQGYGRQSTTILAKAAPRPRAAAAAKAPKFTQSGGTEFTPGVLGGIGVGGTQGVAHFGASTPLLRTTAAGKIEPYSDNAVHRDYLVQRGNGSPMEHVTNNANPQPLIYGGQVVLLKSPTGAVVFPHDPKIIAANQAGDSEPLKAWARAERAKNPGLKPAVFTQATPAKNADLDVGSEEELYQELKKSYTQSTNSNNDKYLTEEDKKKNAKLASMMQAMDKNKSGGAKRQLTDGEIRAAARKLYGGQSATLYIPYTGDSKRRIDATTGFLLRKPEAAKAMADALDAADRDTRPSAAEQRQATVGRGPLAGLTSAASAAKTAPAAKPAAVPASSNKYGFKFKK